jgi:hypothetical protein
MNMHRRAGQGWEKTRVFQNIDPPAGFWVGKWVGKWVFLGSSKIIKNNQK